MKGTFNKCRTCWKTVGWRAIATGTTFTIAYAVDGSFERAGAIAAIDTVVKFVLYYAYEKCWKAVEERWSTAEAEDK